MKTLIVKHYGVERPVSVEEYIAGAIFVEFGECDNEESRVVNNGMTLEFEGDTGAF